MANLPKVSTTTVITVGIFTTGVVDTGRRGGSRKYLCEFSKKFEIIFRGFGVDESQDDPAGNLPDDLPAVVPTGATTGGKD